MQIYILKIIMLFIQIVVDTYIYTSQRKNNEIISTIGSEQKVFYPAILQI
jgi:hypothetical protein